MRRLNVFNYIIFGLVAIGIFQLLLNNWQQIIVPIVVFGAIFYLYKFPPGRRPNRRTRQNHKQQTKKKHTFYIVQTKHEHDDNDSPRHH